MRVAAKSGMVVDLVKLATYTKYVTLTRDTPQGTLDEFMI